MGIVQYSFILVLALGPHLRGPCAPARARAHVQICKMHSREAKLQDVPSFRPCDSPWPALAHTLRARPFRIGYHVKIRRLTKSKARDFRCSSYIGTSFRLQYMLYGYMEP